MGEGRDADHVLDGARSARATIAAQVTANGTLSARGTVQVGAQVSGRVVELHADFNDKVKKGQVIAKLDESVLKAQIDQAQAAYDLAVANVKQGRRSRSNDAERQLKRQKALQEQQLVAGATVEAFEVALDTAKAALVASKAQVSQAAANLAQAQHEPRLRDDLLAGRRRRAVARGRARPDRRRRRCRRRCCSRSPRTSRACRSTPRSPRATSAALKEGMKATFTVDAFPGKTFEGMVRQVRNAPTTTQGVVTYDAVIDVDNEDLALRPGMTANVTFVLEQVDERDQDPERGAAVQADARADAGARREVRRLRGAARRGSGRAVAAAAARAAVARRRGGSAVAAARRRGGRRRRRCAAVRVRRQSKPVWKLVDGKPKMVLVKPGLTDGSSTQMRRGRAPAGRPADHRDPGPADGRAAKDGSVLMTARSIEMRGIERTYVMGDNLVHALRGVDLDDRAGLRRSRSWARRAPASRR